VVSAAVVSRLGAGEGGKGLDHLVSETRVEFSLSVHLLNKQSFRGDFAAESRFRAFRSGGDHFDGYIH